MTWRHVRHAVMGVVALAAACADSTGVVKVLLPNAPARRLITGETVACALTSSGVVMCWGANGQYWDYGVSPLTFAGSETPNSAVVPELASFAAGVATHFCGIKADRSAVCWGRNTFGQLGGGAVGVIGAPVNTVEGQIKWGELAVSRLSTCGRSETGSLYCWGYNQRGELGSTNVPLRDSVPTPSLVEGSRTYATVSAGWQHACALDIEGKAWCWGDNRKGQLGIGLADTVPRRSPQAVSGGLSFRQLSLGSMYTCGLTADSLAYCWGENLIGQLGDGTLTVRASPTLVSGGLKFIEIASGSGFGAGSYNTVPTTAQGGLSHTCALATSKRAYCWGWNGNGELGDGTTVDKNVPTLVADTNSFNTIAVGGAYSCGMKGDNVWCWGSNLLGQVGRGAVGTALTPRPVLPPFGTP